MVQLIVGESMKNPLVRELSKWMFKAYIIWSICADITLLAGVLALLFVDFKIIF